MRAWCWRQELNPQPLAYEAFALPLCYASNPHSASPETSARVELYRPRERLMQRGAQPENSLIHASDLTGASFGRDRFSRTRTTSGASERRTQIAIVDWCCCGPFRSLCLLWRRGCGPPPVSPVFLFVTLVRAAYWSDAGNRASPRTTNANRTTGPVARWRR